MSVDIVVGARFNAGLAAKALIKNNFKVNIYTSSNPKKWGGVKKSIKFTPMPFRLGYTVLGKSLSPRLKELDAVIFDKIVSKRIRPNPILHGWASFSLRSAKKQKKNGGIFLLDRACPHALFQKHLLEEEAELLGIKYSPFSDAFLARMESEYRLADKILVPSEYSYKSFIDNGVERQKLELISLDANFEYNHNHQKTQKNDKQFVVGTIGGNIVRKGLIYLIRSWKKLKLPNSKLLIKCPKENILELPEIAEIVSIDPSIEIVGYVENIQQFYERCDVFCLPSIDDGFGMVVLEALACGLPVISSENVGASQFINDGYNGYVIPIRNVMEISKSLETIYSDNCLREELSANSLESYLQYKNSNVSYERKLTDLYRRLEADA